MSNTYFNFKQFKIDQEGVGMKVSTDACIQGALAARQWQDTQPKRILDIGTGTGLLTLMLAQKLQQSSITALEIDPIAFEKAKENFSNSQWKKNIVIEHSSLQDYQKSKGRFDYIICNPPFFHNHLNSPEQKRNLARHANQLPKEVIAAKAIDLLKENGQLCILYPCTEWSIWKALSIEFGLFPKNILEIQPNANKKPNRIIGFYGRTPNQIVEKNTLEIYEKDTPNYTLEFRSLLKDYYLNL